MPAITCQYGNCLELVGDDGIVVTLKTATFDGEKRAIYCCAAHAAGALSRLAADRGLKLDAGAIVIPQRWRVT
jgi:hypothetical protein